jgi:anti-sigma factor RsiW
MNLENELKRALHRESPAPGFAERVLARIEADQVRGSMPRRRPVWWRAAAASVTLVAVIGGWTAHELAQRRAAEGERAREQVLLALRIASEKVSYAQQEVHGIGRAD